MNQIRVTLFLILCISQANSLFAQVNKLEISQTKNHIIKVNILSPFVATLNASHEYAFRPRWGVENGLSMTQLVLDNNEKRYTSIKGFTYSLDFRNYELKKGKLNGWFDSYFLRYSQYEYRRVKQDSNTGNVIIPIKENMAGVSIGFIKGYRRIYQNKYLLECFFGAYISKPLKYTNNINPDLMKKYQETSFKENPFTNGVGIRIGIKVGYLF
jgi:hypothetical protein